jgi:hypothetical protein
MVLSLAAADSHNRRARVKRMDQQFEQMYSDMADLRLPPSNCCGRCSFRFSQHPARRSKNASKQYLAREVGLPVAVQCDYTGFAHQFLRERFVAVLSS